MVKDVRTPFAPSLPPVSASLLQIISVERSHEERKMNAWLRKAWDAGNLISFCCPLASCQAAGTKNLFFTISNFIKCCWLRKRMLSPKYWLCSILSLFLFRLIVSRESKCFAWIPGVLCWHTEKCDSILSTPEQEFSYTFAISYQALSIPEDWCAL